MMIKKEEIKALVLSILVLGFVFGFDDKQPTFVFSYWLINYIKISLLAGVSLWARVFVQKFMARQYGCVATFIIWKIKRYGIRKAAKLPLTINLGFFKRKINAIYLGIILPILITILSGGQLFFAAVSSLAVSIKPVYRIGKKYLKLTEYESAKIALAGPLTNILFALLLSLINFNFFKVLILINSMMAISYMIPLPGLDGCTIFFGSKLLYVFSLVFIVFTALLLNLIGPLFALVVSLLFAVIAVTISYCFEEFG